MPNVTYNLSDVGLGHLAGLHPEVKFILNGPNVAGSKIFATRPETSIPDSAGNGTVTLADTTVMHTDAWYEMHVRWQEPGSAGSTGYSPVDVHIKTPIRVPSSGGVIGDLIGGITNLSLVYISLVAPSVKLPYMLWYKTNPNNPQDPANTGDIYRWENL